MDYSNPKDLERICKITGATTAQTSEAYQTEISKLFKEWKDKIDTNNTAFITDGVMDPEKWFKQSERIMFVLKEAYSEPYENDWDLAEYALKSDPFKKESTWRNISLWTKGMQCTLADYEPDDKELKSFGNKYLHGIAAINIKKYNGRNTSDASDILQYAVQEKEFIKKEIEICDPNVIVCCGTANAFNHVIDFDYGHYNNQCFYHTILNEHEVIVIDFYHPANRYPRIMNYHTLCAIYQRAKNDQVKRIRALKEN